MTTGFAGDAAWQPVRIGAGGYLTGIDIAPDGTMVARTDTYGAYLWNGTGWTQLITANSMPAGTFYSHGVFEIRVASSNTNVFYMANGDGIFKSIDKGQTWSKTSFSIGGDANGPRRIDGQKLAIDPTNPNVVFAGTQTDGLWVTRDGGATWQKIAAVPQGSNTNDASLTGITIQGSNVFVGTAGSGVYASNDGGYTWSSIGGPAQIGHAAIDPRGNYYASDEAGGGLWKYSGGVWQKVIADGAGVHAVAIDPFNANHVVVTNGGGTIQESKDGGATWTGWNWASTLESSGDVPWLETSGNYMSSGGLVFDPFTPGKIWQSAGVGVWHTALPEVLNYYTPLVWNSASQGIEQLVANEVLAPAGVDPIFASWDRPFFSMSDLDSYAATYGGGGFSMGWSVDYASSDSHFIVGVSDYWGTESSGFSTDGGKTWQKFEGLPSWAMDTVGGSIAASTPTNFIWLSTRGSPPAYTLDGGKTWTNVNIPGVTDWSQLHSSYYLNRSTITADRVQANTFYLYDTTNGVFRTTDGGVTWQKMFNGQVSPWSYWNTKMEAVPGQAGELYFTSGPQSGQPGQQQGLLPFMHSTDGGATWQQVAGVQAATFGFGAAATAGGPTTVYVVGSVNGVFGVWYSADDAQTWTQIGERPMGSMDVIRTISGDMDQFGLVYLGFGGSGYAYLDFAHATPNPVPVTTTPTALSNPPSQTAIIGQAIDDAGLVQTVGNGSLVNDSTPSLTGTLSAALSSGQALAMYRDGHRVGEVSVVGTSWTFTDQGASDGAHDYAVRVEDASGRFSTMSSPFSLSIDATAPQQLVSVTGATMGGGSTGATTVSLKGTTIARSLPAATTVSGTVTGTLSGDETLVVYRDGIRLGVAAVSNGTWQIADSVTDGVHLYTAQVEDAAGNVGRLSDVFSTAASIQNIVGTRGSDVLFGTSGEDRITGVPDGRYLGKGTIDVLTGNGGNDLFILGDARGRFYDDGSSRSSGTADYARITDFSIGDKLQLRGTATDYFQKWTSVGGFSGTGIYHDTNGNGMMDSRDELIALVQGHDPLDASSFLYV